MNSGIANTMDLPEKLLPRISSRMGIQRLCFAPYNYQQLQEIISSRLKGIDVFEKEAIEFASRKFSLYVIWSLDSFNLFCTMDACFGTIAYWFTSDTVFNYSGCSIFRRCTSCFGDMQACSWNSRLSYKEANFKSWLCCSRYIIWTCPRDFTNHWRRKGDCIMFPSFC